MKSSITIMCILGMLMMMSFSTSKTKENPDSAQITTHDTLLSLVVGSDITFTSADGKEVLWTETLTQELKDKLIAQETSMNMEVSVTCFQVCLYGTLNECCVFPNGMECHSLGWVCGA